MLNSPGAGDAQDARPEPSRGTGGCRGRRARLARSGSLSEPSPGAGYVSGSLKLFYLSMEPKLKEEIILLMLNSPNPHLSLPWSPALAERSHLKVLNAFQISNFVCLCNPKYYGGVSWG